MQTHNITNSLAILISAIIINESNMERKDEDDAADDNPGDRNQEENASG